MNRKAQGFAVYTFFGMMVGLMLWIGFTQMLGPATDAAADARSVQQLDCDNSSISIGTKATCVVVDFGVFGWSGAVITAIMGAVGGGLFSKIIKKKDNE